jgi:hypothetical protein
MCWRDRTATAMDTLEELGFPRPLFPCLHHLGTGWGAHYNNWASQQGGAGATNRDTCRRLELLVMMASAAQQPIDWEVLIRAARTGVPGAKGVEDCRAPSGFYVVELTSKTMMPSQRNKPNSIWVNNEWVKGGMATSFCARALDYRGTFGEGNPIFRCVAEVELGELGRADSRVRAALNAYCAKHDHNQRNPNKDGALTEWMHGIDPSVAARVILKALNDAKIPFTPLWPADEDEDGEDEEQP